MFSLPASTTPTPASAAASTSASSPFPTATHPAAAASLLPAGAAGTAGSCSIKALKLKALLSYIYTCGAAGTANSLSYYYGPTAGVLAVHIYLRRRRCCRLLVGRREGEEDVVVDIHMGAGSSWLHRIDRLYAPVNDDNGALLKALLRLY